MAEIQPLGIDQSSGQMRAVSAADSVVNNIGNQQFLVIKNPGDYTSSQTSINSVYPFDIFGKIADPSTLPSNNTRGVSFSPGGEFLIVGDSVAPYIDIYQRTGSTFNRLLTAPSSTSQDGRLNSWTPDGEYFAISSQVAPHLKIYQRSGSSFTQLADPSSLTNSPGRGCKFSPSGEYLCFSHTTMGFLSLYRRSGNTFNGLDAPASAPTDQVNNVSWSNDGKYLAIAQGITSGQNVFLYENQNGNLIRLADPASVPGGDARSVAFSPGGKMLAASNSGGDIFIYTHSEGVLSLVSEITQGTGNINGLAWHPSGQYLAAGSTSFPVMGVYVKHSDNSFTALADPSTLPPSSVFDLTWSSDGQFLAVAHNNSPYLTIYQSGVSSNDNNVSVTNGI